MLVPNKRDPHAPAVKVMPSTCPRRYWRSMNPALPPPDAIQCGVRGPDCCATSAVIDMRRVA